jgi:hypothetical protein
MIFIEGFKDRWIFGPIILNSFNYDYKSCIKELARYEDIVTDC